jgi:hypothetical protein
VAAVLFSTVSVSSVHVPAATETPMEDPVGALMIEEELTPLLHVVQLPPAEYVQPPWIVMSAAFVGNTTCSLPYVPLSRYTIVLPRLMATPMAVSMLPHGAVSVHAEPAPLVDDAKTPFVLARGTQEVLLHSW